MIDGPRDEYGSLILTWPEGEIDPTVSTWDLHDTTGKPVRWGNGKLSEGYEAWTSSGGTEEVSR